jgi:lambda family phage tail tape measure protein
MATNLDYNVNVNATNGIQALNNLQTKVGGLSGAFGKLQTVIGGLAIGAAILNAVRFADAIQDLSDSTGIAVANVLGFGKALQSFGGNSEVAEKGILRLVSNIGAAADGSASLQSAFGRVGVSLSDLATLSEQDILAKVVSGLGNVTDKSEQAFLKQQLLGKEFRNVAINGQALADSYAASTAAAQANAESITRASDAYDKFEKSVGAFKLGILSAISPLTDFVAALEPKKVEEFAQALGSILVVLVGVGGYFKIIKVAATAVGELALAAGGAAAAFATWGLRLARFFGWVGLIISALGALNSLIKFAFDVDPIKELVDWTGKAFRAVKDFLGIKSEDTSEGTKKNTEAVKENTQANTDAGNAAREVIDPFRTLREQISGLADDYARVNKATIDNINLATGLIGKSREESEIRKAVADLAKREADEIRKLTEQKAKLTKEQQQAGLGAEIDAQIEKIKQQTAADMEATETAIRNSERRANARKLEEFAINSQINVENQLQKIQDDIAKSTMSEIEKKQYDILAAAKARAKAEIDAEQIRRGSLMTDQEKLKFYEAAKKGSDDLIRKEKELYDKSRQFSTGWAKAFKEYADNATNAARQAERIFSKVTQGLEDMIVNFVKTGKFEWKDFVSSMLEELLRSQIQQVFAGILGGMGGEMGGGGGGILGALGGLFGMGGGGGAARGGSPNSPVYVSDVAGGGGFGGGFGGAGGQQGGGLWDSISTMAGNVWSGVKNVFGGIADSVGSVFGGVADTVGGIFGGIANSAGNVFGSIGDTIGDAFGGITDAVGGIFGGGNDMGGGGISLGDGGGLWDSISSGIGGLFDGWFANGGNIGAGKFGVVGENGPELVSGPATVTPMGGGTNVTYNINAVDAMSFKQMLAQDPSFIYALSLQGSSGIAGRR